MFKRLKSRAADAIGAFALVAASVTLTAAPANAAGGTVTCAFSTSVGMWVEVQNGTDGFATPSPTANPRVKNWSYNTQGKRFRVYVECGGTARRPGVRRSLPTGRRAVRRSAALTSATTAPTASADLRPGPSRETGPLTTQ